jgi:type IV pilus assembly protein PilC
MSSYCYEAVDAGGFRIQGTMEVASQGEALRRVKEMGLFPTRIAEARRPRRRQANPRSKMASRRNTFVLPIPILAGRVKPRVLAVFTRQLATLVEAGMPLLRGLRILQEQEENPILKRILDDMSVSIEGGSSMSEALAAHPKVFNQLYVNMVKAGELGGALEITLRRLAEFMEKARKIKGKVKAALFYPTAVLIVAAIILGILMVYIVPRFQLVLEGLLGGRPMPAFTLLVFRISRAVTDHFLLTILSLIGLGVTSQVLLRTNQGRLWFDRLKLRMPMLGPVFRKMAISRFARTLGTLLGTGVPVLQALSIVKETAGNVAVSRVISEVHESVKEGETMAAPLKASNVFPAMVAGMVDIGEQTGALPDMLLRVANNYDDEVDDAVNAMTSLLEPIMIVFLAVVVGSIVIALFLPILAVLGGGAPGPGLGGGDI